MDGAVNNYQYWCIDFVKKRKTLELKMAELNKQTEHYKEEFRQYCNKYVSLSEANWIFRIDLTAFFLKTFSEWENVLAPKTSLVDLVSDWTK